MVREKIPCTRRIAQVCRRPRPCCGNRYTVRPAPCRFDCLRRRCHRDPDRVRAVTGIVARKGRIVAARITGAVMDGIVPVVIVVGGYAVPAAVMRLDCVMGPAKTGIRSGDHNSLAGVAERPHLRRMRVIDPGLNRFGKVRL